MALLFVLAQTSSGCRIIASYRAAGADGDIETGAAEAGHDAGADVVFDVAFDDGARTDASAPDAAQLDVSGDLSSADLPPDAVLPPDSGSPDAAVVPTVTWLSAKPYGGTGDEQLSGLLVRSDGLYALFGQTTSGTWSENSFFTLQGTNDGYALLDALTPGNPTILPAMVGGGTANQGTSNSEALVGAALVDNGKKLVVASTLWGNVGWFQAAQSSSYKMWGDPTAGLPSVMLTKLDLGSGNVVWIRNFTATSNGIRAMSVASFGANRDSLVLTVGLNDTQLQHRPTTGSPSPPFEVLPAGTRPSYALLLLDRDGVPTATLALRPRGANDAMGAPRVAVDATPTASRAFIAFPLVGALDISERVAGGSFSAPKPVGTSGNTLRVVLASASLSASNVGLTLTKTLASAGGAGSALLSDLALGDSALYLAGHTFSAISDPAAPHFTVSPPGSAGNGFVWIARRSNLATSGTLPLASTDTTWISSVVALDGLRAGDFAVAGKTSSTTAQLGGGAVSSDALLVARLDASRQLVWRGELPAKPPQNGAEAFDTPHLGLSGAGATSTLHLGCQVWTTSSNFPTLINVGSASAPVGFTLTNGSRQLLHATLSP